MLIEVAAFAVVVALLRGVRVEDLGRLTFRGMSLLGVVIILRLGTRAFPGASHFLFPASMLVLIIFALVNMQIRGLKLVVAGLIANFTAIVLSGGKMPVDSLVASLVRSGSPQFLTHVSTNGNMFQRFLGDVIVIGPPYPWPLAISLGDVALSVGVLQAVMFITEHRHSS